MGFPAIRVPVAVIDKFTAPIRLFTARVNGMTKPIDDITKRMNRLHTAVSGALKAVAKPFKFAASPIMAVGRGIGGVLGGIGGMLSSAGGMLGVASIGAAATGMVKLTKDTAEFAEELNNTAIKWGTNMQQVQMLQHAAKMADVDADLLNTSMIKLSQSIGAAMGGDKKKIGLLTALGIDITKTKSPEAILLKIADAMKKIKNVNLRNVALKELFGKSGVGMSLMFQDGSAGIQQYMDARKKMGLMDEEGLKKSQKFQEAWKTFGAVMQGLRNTVGLELMNSFTGIIQRVGEFLTGKQGAIKEFFRGIAANLTDENINRGIKNLQDIAVSLGNILETTSKLIGPLTTTIDLLSKAGKVIDVGGEIFGGAGRKRYSDNEKRPPSIWDRPSTGAAAALSAGSGNRDSVQTNQAFLKIQVLSDGNVKTSMLGNLGQNVGWSMVTP